MRSYAATIDLRANLEKTRSLASSASRLKRVASDSDCAKRAAKAAGSSDGTKQCASDGPRTARLPPTSVTTGGKPALIASKRLMDVPSLREDSAKIWNVAWSA